MANAAPVIRVCTFVSQLEDPDLYAFLAEPKGRSALARMLLRKGLWSNMVPMPMATTGQEATNIVASATPSVAEPAKSEDIRALEALNFAFDFPAAGSTYDAGVCA